MPGTNNGGDQEVQPPIQDSVTTLHRRLTPHLIHVYLSIRLAFIPRFLRTPAGLAISRLMDHRVRLRRIRLIEVPISRVATQTDFQLSRTGSHRRLHSRDLLQSTQNNISLDRGMIVLSTSYSWN